MAMNFRFHEVESMLDCKTRENSNFLNKGKIVILVKNMKFII